MFIARLMFHDARSVGAQCNVQEHFAPSGANLVESAGKL